MWLLPARRYYPYHYAPLISDLAKHATGGKRNKATIGSEVLSTEDDDWAPLNGPVRPLVQLMAVLPPERYFAQSAAQSQVDKAQNRALRHPVTRTDIKTIIFLFLYL